MVAELQKSFIEILKSTSWLDEQTLQVAIEKVGKREMDVRWGEGRGERGIDGSMSKLSK